MPTKNFRLLARILLVVAAVALLASLAVHAPGGNAGETLTSFGVEQLDGSGSAVNP